MSPEETVAFLVGVELMLVTFSAREREVPAGAVAWDQPYTAPCELSMLDGPPDHNSVLDNLQRH